MEANMLVGLRAYGIFVCVHLFSHSSCQGPRGAVGETSSSLSRSAVGSNVVGHGRKHTYLTAVVAVHGREREGPVADRGSNTSFLSAAQGHLCLYIRKWISQPSGRPF